MELAIAEAKERNLNIKGAITVDMFGNPCEYDQIKSICDNHEIFHISDIAQSFGATYKEKSVASFGDIATTSFSPTKPLDCYGGNGMIFTQNTELADTIKSLCVHGKGTDEHHNVRTGFNSRFDTIQACVSNHKLPFFEGKLKARDELADFYNSFLVGTIQTPQIAANNSSAWAVYSLLHPKRDAIIAKLAGRSLPSNVYYKTTLHDQPAYNHFPKAKNMYNSE